MSDVVVFNGREEIPVPFMRARKGDDGGAQQQEQQPIPPDPRNGDGSIFVSIVSYRDGERCGKTLQSIFDNAKDPTKVVVGLMEQNAPDDKFCIEEYCSHFGIKAVERQRVREDVTKIFETPELAKCPYRDQIRLVAFHHISAKGPIYARSLGRKALSNEEFCMQVDAHTAFVQDWDAMALEDWMATKNEFAVLSNVPAATAEQDLYGPTGSKFRHVPRQCRLAFRDNGYPDYESPADGYASNLDQPLLSHGWSAAFSFAKCHLEESVPYDAFSWYAKPIEQFGRYARMWTRGYDVYTPTRNMVMHEYGVQQNGHGNNEWFKRQRDRFRKEAIDRAKMTIQIEIDEPPTEAELANLGLYGLGKRRSLAQLEKFANINLSTKQGNVGPEIKCIGHEWVPYDASISPVENLYGNPDNLDPQPEYPLRTKLVYYQQVDEPIARIDLELAGGTAMVSGSVTSDVHDTVMMLDSQPLSFPPVSVLFILWIFGLIVWYVMFMVNPASGAAPSSAGGVMNKTTAANKARPRTKKASSGVKDV